jgi:hypothetical protein
VKVQFDADAMLLQVVHPSIQFRVSYSEADMLRPAGAVGGHIAAFERCSGIEQEQHGVAAAKEDVPGDFRGEDFQREDIAVKHPGGFEIIHVKRSFKNTLKLHESTEAVNCSSSHR